MNTMELSDSIKDYYRLLMASKNEKSVKQKNRYDVVLLYMEGYSRKRSLKSSNIPLRTVSYHILSYEKGGHGIPSYSKTARSTKETYG